MNGDDGLGGGSGNLTIDQIREMIGKDAPESMRHQANFWKSIADQHDKEADRVHGHIRHIEDNWTSKSATAATTRLNDRKQGLTRGIPCPRT